MKAQFKLRCQRKSKNVLTTYYSPREVSEWIRLETSVLFWLQIRCWREYCPQPLVQPPCWIYCIPIPGSWAPCLITPWLTVLNHRTPTRLVWISECHKGSSASLPKTPRPAGSSSAVRSRLGCQSVQPVQVQPKGHTKLLKPVIKLGKWLGWITDTEKGMRALRVLRVRQFKLWMKQHQELSRTLN